MFGIRNLSHRVYKPVIRDYSHLPQIVEGAELLDTLCPVSHETGQRENALSLLTKVLDPKHQYLVQQILQVVPSFDDPQGISDDDALDFMTSQFDLGSAYDNQMLRDSLSRSLDVLIPRPQSKEESIQFDGSDAETKDKE